MVKKSIGMIFIVVLILSYGCSMKEDIEDKSAAKEIQEKSDNPYTLDQLNDGILENDIELVKRIIKSKTIDLNKKDSDGKYPIEMVLVMENCEMASILLEAGADPYIIIKDNKSVYDIATESKSKKLRQIFSKYK